MDNCSDLHSVHIKVEQTELIIKEEPAEEVTKENSSLDIKYDTSLPTLNTQVEIASICKIGDSEDISACQIKSFNSKFEMEVEEQEHITQETIAKFQTMVPKPKNVNRKANRKKKLFQYEPYQMANALAAVRSNGMKVATACKLYGVPRTTIRNKLNGKFSDITGKVGSGPVLGKDMEDKLVEWIKNISKMGFPVGREGLIYSVKKLVEKGNLSTPFIQNTPGRKWFHLFMTRHQEITQKQSEYINRTHSLVTENQIRGWFEETLELLKENKNILDDPSRVWNMEETSFYLCPKGSLILAEKRLPVYDSSYSDKENITTLMAVNAMGQVANPLTIYKYDKLPEKITKSAPPNWDIGKSAKGRMNSTCFFEYFVNTFIPFLEKIKAKLPVIVFLNGHSSHLSLPFSELCLKKQIITVCLLPNSTHILQPLDVSFFFPLKAKWRSAVTMFEIEQGHDIKKFDVPKILKKIMNELDFKTEIINGFRKCGLWPFNPDNVDYSKYIMKVERSQHEQNNKRLNNTNTESLSHLEYLESKINANTLLDFKNLQYTELTKSLFDIWILFKQDNNTTASTTENNLEDCCVEFDFPEFNTDENILNVDDTSSDI